MENGASKNTIN